MPPFVASMTLYPVSSGVSWYSSSQIGYMAFVLEEIVLLVWYNFATFLLPFVVLSSSSAVFPGKFSSKEFLYGDPDKISLFFAFIFLCLLTTACGIERMIVGETCAFDVEGYGDDDDDDDDCSFDVRQAGIFTGAASLFEVDGFGDSSSPCKIAAEPFVSFSAKSGTNETWAGPKSSSEKT
jgi:hypothetical protein